MSNLYNLIRGNSVNKNSDKTGNMAKAGNNSGRNDEAEEKIKGGKKGKKSKESSANKELDSITCNTCKKVFTEEDSKILCCDRCELWFCITCANVTEACYKFLASKDAEDIAWYCKNCKIPAKTAVIEDKSIEDKCKEYTKELNQKMKTIETSIQKKADITELQKLQQKVEENENKLKGLIENKKEGRTWAEIMETPEKRTVQEVIEKSLKERESEEKERQSRRKNIIIFDLPESKETEPDARKEEDTKKVIGLCKNIINITFDQSMIDRAIRLGKATEGKDRPLLVSLKEENKKREIFQNLNKIRESGAPFNKINISHDLTKKQKEELKEIIEEAQKKEQNDQSGEWMYRVRGPPWNWYIKKIPKRTF